MIRTNRPIRSRQDYYAANADPNRPTLGSGEGSAQFGYWRSARTIEEMRRRPEALRTGAGNLRPVGVGQPYVSGMGKPSIERGDIETDGGASDQENEFWGKQGIQTESEEFQRQQIRNPLWKREVY